MKDSRDTIEIKNNDDVLFGYQLTADFTAEHEWGIEGLLSGVNLDGDGFGVDGVRTNKDSNILSVIEISNGFVLLAEEKFDDYSFFSSDFLLKRMSNSNSMWDGSNFAIFSESRELFDKLVKAEKDNDLGIGLFGDFSPLSRNKGLYVIVKSLNV